MITVPWQTQAALMLAVVALLVQCPTWVGITLAALAFCFALVGLRARTRR